MPVLVAATAPHPNAQAGVFEVYPAWPCFVRPDAVPARVVTPTKACGASAPPAAHYLAILEATVANSWPSPSRSRPGLLERLDARLAKSVDRAFSEGLLPEDGRRVTDLVAVVGVVAPEPCLASVRARLAAAAEQGTLCHLRAMADAGRFVFVCQPRAAARPG